jgi:hypothetical protein
MSELNDLEILLDRVLPDPMGFAERVIQQILDRVAYPSPGGNPVTVMTSSGEGVERGAGVNSALEEQNLVLAAALGACSCWGSDPDCALCAGHGCAAWMPPDPTLYDTYVAPAADRMSAPRTSTGAGSPQGVQNPGPEKKENAHDRGNGGKHRSRIAGV